MTTLVIVSGYFNPLHKGHIEYLYKSKALDDDTDLLVIINNDVQRALKGSKPFMGEEERRVIVQALKPVDHTIISVDQRRDVSDSIRLVVEKYGNMYNRILFANGGDQTEETIPETAVCSELGVEMVFGLGDKIQSSSWLLKDR